MLALLAVLAVPVSSDAEDAESLRRELDAIRRNFETLTREYERKIEELSERVRALESPAPPATTATAPPPITTTAPPAAAETSLADILAPRQPFALGQSGRALLFVIGVSGDFVADFTSDRHERRHDGTFAGRENRLFPREVSVGFFGRVDPYAAAVVRITAGEEAGAPGESVRELTVNLEEANVTLFTLPLGTTARFGLMRPRFGTLNAVHEDDLPQVDRPDVLRRFFGEEQLNSERGVDAFRVLPTPFFQEVAVGIFDGDNEVAFGRGSLRDPVVLGRLRTFIEGDEWGGLQIDLSGGTGPSADDRRNTVAGLGLKYKWAPLSGHPFPVVTLATEAIYGHHVADRWGYYVYAQYDWTRRWAAGLRWDWTESPTESGHEWALSPYLQFKPSEFLRLRVQYKHSDGTIGRAANELFLQGSFILGAHPTERL